MYNVSKKTVIGVGILISVIVVVIISVLLINHKSNKKTPSDDPSNDDKIVYVKVNKSEANNALQNFALALRYSINSIEDAYVPSNCGDNCEELGQTNNLITSDYDEFQFGFAMANYFGDKYGVVKIPGTSPSGEHLNGGYAIAEEGFKKYYQNLLNSTYDDEAFEVDGEPTFTRKNGYIYGVINSDWGFNSLILKFKEMTKESDDYTLKLDCLEFDQNLVNEDLVYSKDYVNYQNPSVTEYADKYVKHTMTLKLRKINNMYQIKSMIVNKKE